MNSSYSLVDTDQDFRRSLMSPPPINLSFWQQSTSSPAMSKARRTKILLSYLPDWIITIVLAAVFFALDKVPGYRRDFSLTDTSYAVHERIPNIALYFIAVVAPFVLQGLVNLITVRSWWDFHSATLGLILGLATTGAFTQFTKITVGRPRPDIVSRCIPKTGSVDPLWGLSNADICTQTSAAIMKDGWRSFFSGHSSLSFAGLGFLAFYMAGKFHLFDGRGHAAKTWVCLVPIAAASLVAYSRSMDYRHHWTDILTGCIVGLVFAYFSYRQYYPHLASPMSHRPYSPRIGRDDGIINELPLHSTHGNQEDQHHESMEGGYRDVELQDGTGPAKPTAMWPLET
ncbi:PAP2-domain-containing protein [Athelia psychrophila]|uniref:PAP2-domain-containing protein n=1 Tax=Athelia psychrophila TaxID=1759441 RepID=A0A166JDN6_9AGAM|nr:PAP2-domain-containing protein [Fibularhizoctonia sp. CBS 109695]